MNNRLFTQFLNNKWKCLNLTSTKLFSTTSQVKKRLCCKILIVGGGTAGCNMAHRFSRILCKNEIIILEPSEVHYYQPDFTFIGAGVRKLGDAVKATIQVLPTNAVWLRDEAVAFCPDTNTVMTKEEALIEYEYMILAVGVVLDFDEIKGLPEALECHRNVCSIYSPEYVEKTFRCFKDFVRGTAIFTAPRTTTKCQAAAFKICFLAEDYFRKHDKLCEAQLTYCTANPNLFPVEEYQKTLLKVFQRKNIDVHYRTNLVEVIPNKNTAIFNCIDNPSNNITMEYNMLHVTPPMGTPKALRNCKELVTKYYYADVDLNTLQHKTYPNIFALGDCTPGTANKTSSAVSVQSVVVFKNLSNIIAGKPPTEFYNGYTACPILTGYRTCLLAEFDYNYKRFETLPWKQNKESRLSYYIKRYLLYRLYWTWGIKGLFDINKELMNKLKIRK